jgi:flagellar basal-body rod modification protein FlgD
MTSTSSVSSTNSSSGFGLTTAQDQALDKQDFLKLLIAQIKNQDPLEPQQNSEYVAQLAQFSNLEQTTAINDRLDLLLLQARGQSNTQVLGMIGQKATVNGSTITLDGSGTGTKIGFTLNASAAKTKVSILNSNGDVVRTIETGSQRPGYVSVNWDGKNSSGTIQPAGSYKVSVSAADQTGKTVTVNQQTSGVIEGISFDAGYAVLHLDNGAEASVSNLLKVEASPVTTTK